MSELPEQRILQELLRYQPQDGRLFWKERKPAWFEGNARFSPESAANMWNGRNAGKEAFLKRKDGYPFGTLLGQSLLAHRVIWKMVHGEDPETIDHINGIPSDNRIENLRSVSQAENNKNKALFKANKSGHAGIVQAQYGMWKVQVGTKYIGCFRDLQAAVDARNLALEGAGYHQNHGRART